MTLIPKPVGSPFNDRQWQAIHTTGSNLLVAASAGSGKTTVLIERIYQHILKGYARVDELLVVTFTELAALEMKERMEVRLKQAVSEATDADRRYFSEELQKLPQAHIQTLHSFCLSLIQEYFYLIDFDPSFTLITDETQKQLLLEEVWDDLVADIVESEDLNFSMTTYLDLLSRFSSTRSDEGLYQTVLDLHEFASSHPNPEGWLRQINYYSQNFETFAGSDLYQKTLQAWVAQAALMAINFLDQAQAELRHLQDQTIEKYASLLSEEQERYQAVYQANQAGDLKQLIDLIANFTYDRWPANRKKDNEDYQAVRDLKEYRDQAKESFEGLQKLFVLDYETYQSVEEQIAETLEHLIHLVLIYRSYLAEKKKELNQIDYNDLEHLTLEILAPLDEEGQRQPTIAASFYQGLFQELLIDEYQDINEIQAEILYWLSRNPCEGQPGNQFMVGDVKQSIYGFRLADPSLFMDKYDAYQQGHGDGSLIILDQNYRSRPEVLDFTNFIFERLMDTTFGEMDYGFDEALKVGVPESFEENSHHQFDVQLLLHCQEDQSKEDSEDERLLSIETKEEAQAHLVAQDIIRRIQAQEGYQGKNGDFHPLQYNDFVILSSTRHSFLAVQRVFELYQLPLNTQNIETYFKRQEVQVLLALLKVIDNPKQDLPLLAVLRSYFVQLSDEELSWIRIRQPEGLFYEAILAYLLTYQEAPWKYSTQEEALVQKLTHWLDQLAHWQKINQEESLVQLIWTIYHETNYLEYIVGLSNGHQREANLHAFYERADDYSQTHHQGLFGFIQYIEKMTERDQDLAEPRVIDPDENYIQLMTIHASKGLEFPYVYIIQTEKNFNLQDTQGMYITSKDYGVGMYGIDYERMIRYPSLVREALKLEKEMALKSEEMRKLYVAFTRAEYKLTLVGSIDSKEKWQEEQEELAAMLTPNTFMIPLHERLKSRTWLQWVQDALAIPPRSQDKISTFSLDNLAISWYHTQDLQKEMETFPQVAQQYQPRQAWWQGARQVLDKPQKPLAREVEAFYTYSYPYGLATATSSYQSVSELKRLYEEPHIEKLSSDFFSDRRPEASQAQAEGIRGIRYTQDTFEPPSFIREHRLSPAERGTAVHYLMQAVDYRQVKSLGQEEIFTYLENLLADLVEAGGLTSELAQMIDLSDIVSFIQTSFGQELAHLDQEILKEQAFSYLVPASKLLNQQIDTHDLQEIAQDEILIHGVVDGYYQTDKGLVLFDYKTDRYRPYGGSREEQIDQLKQTYRFQLSLYAQALTTAKSQPLDRAYLVLLDFGQAVELDNLYLF